MTNLLSECMKHPTFIPGLDLGEGFFNDLVRPLLESHLPGLPYSAGIFGGCSEVLGFDTEMSTDHDWGPGVKLFLRQEGFETFAEKIRALAMEHLPVTYRDYPIRIYARTVRDPGERHRFKFGDPRLERARSAPK